MVGEVEGWPKESPHTHSNKRIVSTHQRRHRAPTLVQYFISTQSIPPRYDKADAGFIPRVLRPHARTSCNSSARRHLDLLAAEADRWFRCDASKGTTGCFFHTKQRGNISIDPDAGAPSSLFPNTIKHL